MYTGNPYVLYTKIVLMQDLLPINSIYFNGFD